MEPTVEENMSTTCKYCNEPENKQERPGLICDTCICFVHLACLRRPGTPGDLTCDVFFEFTCEDCTFYKDEKFKRNKMSWVNVILLTLYHLNAQAYGISNHGFFHYKTHICSFIDRNWQTLFGPQSKQKKNWIGTIAGVLSVYNNLFFSSGSNFLRETGWWRLQHAFSPAVAAHIIQEMARDKPKGRPRNHMALDQAHFFEKVTEMGYKELLKQELPASPEEVPSKKKRVDSDELSHLSNTSYDHLDSDSRQELCEESLVEANSLGTGFSDGDQLFKGFDFGQSSYVPPSDSSSLQSYHQSALFYDSDSASHSPAQQIPEEHHSDEDDKSEIKKLDAKLKKPTEEKPIIKRETLFSSQLNSIDMPWMTKKEPEPSKDIKEMSQYDEVQLLKQIENLIPKVKDPNKKAELHRFRAKLALRRLKRHKHLPVFDLDKTVKLLGGYITDDPRVVMNAERVLDRFQRSYLLDSLCGTVAGGGGGTGGAALVSRVSAAPLRSPYSGAALKPYIRRDAHASPTWLKLMDELLRKTNKHIPNYEPPPRATIDYSYVHPQHIAAVNNICAQFFWPGIDLSESLQYPEFSCVVTYKRLVVGCAFLVPDVGPHEAYISFILTRPEWRNAKIASFMLYHLLQTCSGKDVTLHVSPTNPAIFLYQKFGFKVEELIQDFYEKYFDIDFKGCRHALFLRLVR